MLNVEMPAESGDLVTSFDATVKSLSEESETQLGDVFGRDFDGSLVVATKHALGRRTMVKSLDSDRPIFQFYPSNTNSPFITFAFELNLLDLTHSAAISNALL